MTGVNSGTLDKLLEAERLLREARDDLKKYGESLPRNPDTYLERDEQQVAIGAVNQAMRAIPLATSELRGILRRIGGQ